MAESFLEREARAAERLAPALKQVADETERLASGMGSVTQAASVGTGAGTTGGGTTGRALTGPVNITDRLGERDKRPSRGASGGSNVNRFLEPGGEWVQLPNGILVYLTRDELRARKEAILSGLSGRQELRPRLSMGGGGGGSGGGGGGGGSRGILPRQTESEPLGAGGVSFREAESTQQAILQELRVLNRNLSSGPSPGSLARSR